jgi:hypothetical protein
MKARDETEEQKVTLSPQFDKDGDITDETYNTIQTWNLQKGWNSFIDYIEKCYDKNYGRFEIDKEANMLKIATGGWSCNETVISAMRANILFWSLHWELSKRGGYFEFSLPTK